MLNTKPIKGNKYSTSWSSNKNIKWKLIKFTETWATLVTSRGKEFEVKVKDLIE